MKKYEKELLVKLLEDMLTVRMFEEAIKESALKGEIKGNVHVCLGEEGLVAGANMAIKPTDFTTLSHRGHGHCILKSKDVEHTMAEIFGRTTGFCKGRGGSMHVTDIKSGLLGANGIVGGGISIATGSALASKINGDGAVTVCFFGDGASNTGSFHECLNMAATWKLPVVYFIENNQYAVSVNINNVINTNTLAERSKAYNIPSIVVDGTDVLAVYEATLKALKHARENKGPMLVECNVYRFTGHYIGDSAKYKTEEYKAESHEKDVIKKFKEYILKEKIVTVDEIEVLEQSISEKIATAMRFALDSPNPQKEDVLMYNYADDNERCVLR